MSLNDHYLFSRTSDFEPLIVLMTGATSKSLFFTVNGFNPKLSALKIIFNYLMHIFMGFYGPLTFLFAIFSEQKKEALLMAL